MNGWIWVSLATGDAPDFEPWVRNWRTVTAKYGTTELKIATRVSAPTRANWKLVLENFRECYHCYPAHTKTYSAVHQNLGNPDNVDPRTARAYDAELEKWDGKPLQRRERDADDDGNRRANANAYRWAATRPPAVRRRTPAPA